jgi:hypothetical protein
MGTHPMLSPLTTPAFLPSALPEPVYELHLYVAGVTPRATTARRNLEAIWPSYSSEGVK